MALDSSQRGPGVTSVSDADLASASPEERAKQEARFVEQQNDRALARARVMKKHGDSLKNLSSAEAREVTMGKLLDMEYRAIAKEREAASVIPATPDAPPTQAPPKEAGPVTQETPLSILEMSRWFEWDDKAYSAEVYPQFVSAFVPELSRALADMPKDMQKSTALMHQIEMLFKQKLFKMYLNGYPQIQGADDTMAAERQLSGWLNERWAEVFAAARRLPPVR